MPMGKGGVTPVGCGRAILMGDAVARAERVAARSATAYILLVWRVLADFGGDVDLDAFCLVFLLFKVTIE